MGTRYQPFEAYRYAVGLPILITIPPTFTSNDLDSFDAIDSRDIGHSINFSLENKLQTKRNDEVVELLRALIGTDFALKENPGKGDLT